MLVAPPPPGIPPAPPVPDDPAAPPAPPPPVPLGPVEPLAPAAPLPEAPADPTPPAPIVVVVVVPTVALGEPPEPDPCGVPSLLPHEMMKIAPPTSQCRIMVLIVAQSITNIDIAASDLSSASGGDCEQIVHLDVSSAHRMPRPLAAFPLSSVNRMTASKTLTWMQVQRRVRHSAMAGRKPAVACKRLSPRDRRRLNVESDMPLAFADVSIGRPTTR